LPTQQAGIFEEGRVYRFARDEGIDLEELRTRLRKMTDEDLLRLGEGSSVHVSRQIAPAGVRDSVAGGTSRVAKAESKVAGWYLTIEIIAS
jgi:hypothetical protein